jgi:hypothetical protein
MPVRELDDARPSPRRFTALAAIAEGQRPDEQTRRERLAPRLYQHSSRRRAAFGDAARPRRAVAPQTDPTIEPQRERDGGIGMPSFNRRLLSRLPLINIALALVAFWIFVVLWLFGVL